MKRSGEERKKVINNILTNPSKALIIEWYKSSDELPEESFNKLMGEEKENEIERKSQYTGRFSKIFGNEGFTVEGLKNKIQDKELKVFAETFNDIIELRSLVDDMLFRFTDLREDNPHNDYKKAAQELRACLVNNNPEFRKTLDLVIRLEESEVSGIQNMSAEDFRASKFTHMSTLTVRGHHAVELYLGKKNDKEVFARYLEEEGIGFASFTDPNELSNSPALKIVVSDKNIDKLKKLLPLAFDNEVSNFHRLEPSPTNNLWEEIEINKLYQKQGFGRDERP